MRFLDRCCQYFRALWLEVYHDGMKSISLSTKYDITVPLRPIRLISVLANFYLCKYINCKAQIESRLRDVHEIS